MPSPGMTAMRYLRAMGRPPQNAGNLTARR